MAKFTLNASALAVYHVIEKYHSLDGRSPGIRKIRDECGFASTSTVEYNLELLERAGWIRRERKRAYAIVPIHYPRVYYRRQS